VACGRLSREGNAPADTEGDAGGSVRGHGCCEGARLKPARTGPESRERRKSGGEVGGDGGHVEEAEGWRRQESTGHGNGSVAAVGFCQFAVDCGGLYPLKDVRYLSDLISPVPQFRRYYSAVFRNMVLMSNFDLPNASFNFFHVLNLIIGNYAHLVQKS